MTRYFRSFCSILYFAFSIVAVVAADEPPKQEESPVGWASVDGGTTGGRGGPTTRVADEASLREKLKGDEPATVVLTGAVVLTEKIRVGSNKTLLGEGKKGELTGAGLHLSKARNIILRNLTIRDSGDDAINVE